MLATKFLGIVAIAAMTVGFGACSIDQAEAATLSFNFSFDNMANGGGTVTGSIRGLTNNTTSAATSVEVWSNTLGFGIGEYVGNPVLNSWTVSGGVIQSFNFLSFGIHNTFPSVTTSSLILGHPEYPKLVGLTPRNDLVYESNFTGLTFTPITSIPTPALVPSLIGLGAMLLRQRKYGVSDKSAEIPEV